MSGKVGEPGKAPATPSSGGGEIRLKLDAREPRQLTGEGWYAKRKGEWTATRRPGGSMGRSPVVCSDWW